MTIHCRAMARYTGRIDAELGLSDVVLIIKDDGAVVLHSMQAGVNPRNWMPSATEMDVIPGGLRFHHAKRGETLEVFIEQEYARIETEPSLAGDLVKLGAEREFGDLLAADVERIEKGMSLISREYRTPAGPVDLFCHDRQGNPTCIELKRVRVTLDAVWQCKRYLFHLQQMEEWQGTTPRGILVAPSLQKTAGSALVDEPHMSFVRIRYEDLEGARTRSALAKDP